MKLTERQNASHDDAWNRLRVDRLIRDLPRDLIRPDRVLQRSLAEAEVSADKRQRNRHAEPQGQDRNEGREWNRAGAFFVPQHEVHHEEQAEHDAGAEDRRQQYVALPLDAAEAFVDAGGHVTSRCAQQHEQDHRAGHQSAAVGRREESQASEGQRDERHAKNLNTRAEQHRQQHSLARRSEHVTMHQLPA